MSPSIRPVLRSAALCLIATGACGVNDASRSTGTTNNPPKSLSISQQPSSTTAGGSIAVKVVVRDANGVQVEDQSVPITAAIANSPGGPTSVPTLNGTPTVSSSGGIATFSGLSINKAGVGYTLAFSSPGLTGVTSNAFDITAGAPTALTITVPSSVTAVPPTPFGVEAAITDNFGNVCTAIPPQQIVLSFVNNPTGATLGGQLSVATVAGLASFSGITIDKPGTGYTLGVSAPGLTPAASLAVSAVVSSNVLTFTVQPSTSTAGVNIGPSVEVTARDPSGGTLSNFTGMVSVTLAPNSAGATLGGTTSASANGGVAVFSNLQIIKAGTDFRILASAPNFSTATSDKFNINPGPVAAVQFLVQPSSAKAGAVMTPAVQVGVVDAFGNVATNATGTVGVTLPSTSTGTLGGTKAVVLNNGIGTFPDLTLTPAGTYQLIGFSGSRTVLSTIFQINP